LIEVFQKPPQQTFDQAVQSLFALEKLNCDVIVVSSSTTSSMPTNILPPFTQELEALSGSMATDTCQYQSVIYDSNGSPYFAYDANYPDRFYFYDLGQAVWPLTGPEDDNNSNSWATTIQLLKFD
jgi:hypothetical protein